MYYKYTHYMIPKIIHQTWKTNIIPSNWIIAVESCKKINKDYQHIIWTDDTMIIFVKENYPELYDMYCNYKYNIQRCDVFRYLVLYKYGGIYLDMDIICKSKLDYLLSYDIVFAKSSNIKSSFTNSFFMAQPNNRFIKYAIDNLYANMNKYKYLGKHFHIMNSTGPSYLNYIYIKYLNENEISNNYILSNNEFAGNCNVCNEDKCEGGSLFIHIKGSSWHSFDSKFYNFILCNYKKIIIMILIFFILYFIFYN
jgi:mannosyltransferase OCH1-like enzyme